jgi:hypothetical protein
MELNKENSIIREDIKIEAFHVHKKEQNIAQINYYKKFVIPAESKRDWMNEDSVKFIYSCVPIVAANSMGWWILNCQELEVRWNGGTSISDIEIRDLAQEKNFQLCSSHFGSGILTFNMVILFKTPPGWGLWVGGPSNIFIDGLFPLEGIVETNWSPFTFTMNYKITRSNHWIKIPRFHPICRIMPIPLNLNDKSKLDWKHLEENPDLMQKHSEWNDSRAEHIRKMHTGETKERQDYYKKGIDTKGCPYLGLHKLFYRYSKPNQDTELGNN